ncbi:MAG: heme biosynthesis protein HemY [Burkholderiales bacterium]|nr:heme biosynthesis protein HemY [Burkholderiales bacterium]
MRAVLWLLALFAVAAAVALFAGNNQGTVTLFWPPYRIDLSLNLVLLVLLGAYLLLHAALNALAALFDLPRQAKRWRNQQKERAMHASMLDSLSHLLGGRYIRARRSAEGALSQEQSLADAGQSLANASQLRALANLLAAESAQALQDRTGREEHLKLALQAAARDAQDTHDGALMRAARWSLEDREPNAALGWLKGMPHGAARRTLALRTRLKASRLAGQSAEALETARLLAKHHAFSTEAAQSLVRGLAIDLLNGAYDTAQLTRAWALLEPSERLMPEVAVHAARRLAAMGGEPHLARDWLLPVWERYGTLGDTLKIRLVHALEDGLDSLDGAWLARLEAAQKANPRDPTLQYLAGMACMKRQLWGKAQQLLTQAALGLQDVKLHRQAWRSLAELAERRGDGDSAGQAWKRAASD